MLSPMGLGLCCAKTGLPVKKHVSKRLATRCEMVYHRYQIVAAMNRARIIAVLIALAWCGCALDFKIDARDGWPEEPEPDETSGEPDADIRPEDVPAEDGRPEADMADLEDIGEQPEEEAVECAVDGDCDDDNICNGAETCNPASHTCVEGMKPDDGTACGADPRRICRDGACSASTCGDGFVDAGGGEECEHGDTERCETSCGTTADRPCGTSCRWDDCPPPAEAVRINAGGALYIDSSGDSWMADVYFTGGFAYSTTETIAGTTEQLLFQTERVGLPPFSYAIPVAADGTYTVNLLFAEIMYQNPGRRVFDVSAEDILQIDDLDLFATAGYLNAYVRSFTVPVNDGILDLDFESSVEYAKVNAIEVCR
jgi:hypothetical protein